MHERLHLCVTVLETMSNPAARRSVLGLVPARGGSKGIPGKNIRTLAGKPLLAYTAIAAKKSAHLSRILLSTDDAEIGRVGEQAGFEVPFIRPPELALDSTPMIDVVLHAIQWVYARGEHYDAICLLQPTSPLRSAATIDRCIRCLWDRDVDTVVSVRPVPHEYNPYWVFFEGVEGLLERSMRDREISCRQQLPSAYRCDGSVYVVRTHVITQSHTLYGRTTVGVTSPENEAFDLDTEEQWQSLERCLHLES